ncbi:MAG TPA: acyltransferase [Solirubrobacteraceae bacterium]|nr:acyltransferase [Solirubrobacteraceae bacterium]
MSARDAPAAVPDAVAPPPRHRRFPLVDGVRAIAVLTVVAVHAAVFGHAIDGSPAGRLLAHLNVGVTIFFLVSGFLLYRPFVAHRGGGAAPPAVGQYAKRRLLRIFPAYWLVVTVLVLVPGTTGVVAGEWWQQYGLLQTLPLADGPGCTGEILRCGVAQTWSLVVEVTFYAVLPLYVLLAARITRGAGVARWMWTELGLLALLSVVSLALHFAVLEPAPRSVVGGSVVGFAFWFALGMGMAVVSVALDGRAAPARLGAGHAGLLWLGAAALYVALSVALPATPFVVSRRDQLAVHLAFGVIALLVLAPAVFGDGAGGLVRRLLRHPVAAWLGLISYGIFLWHYVIALELGPAGLDAGFGTVLAGTLALAIPCAALSYYAVERPLLRRKHRAGAGRAGLAAALPGPPREPQRAPACGRAPGPRRARP